MGFLDKIFGRKKAESAPARPKPGTPEFDALYLDNMLWAVGDEAPRLAQQIYVSFQAQQLKTFAEGMTVAKIVGATPEDLIKTWDEGMAETGRPMIEEAFRKYMDGFGDTIRKLGHADKFEALVTQHVDRMVTHIRVLAIDAIVQGMKT